MTRLTMAAALAALSTLGCNGSLDEVSQEDTQPKQAESQSDVSVDNEAEENAMTANPDYQITVEGMTCGNCVANVTKALEGFDGVKSADVDLESGVARVYMNEGAELDSAEVTKAIDGRGFTTKSIEHSH